MRLSFLFLCFTLNIFISFSQYASKDLINKAHEAFEMQRWKSAATLYNLVVQDSVCYNPFVARAIIADFLANDSLSVQRARGHIFKYSDNVLRLLDDVSRLSVKMREFDVYEPVVDVVEEMLPHKKDSLRYSLVKYYLFLKQSEDVIRLCDKYIELEPDNLLWYNMKAKAYLSKGEADNARDVYLYIFSKDPGHYQANTFLGNYYYIKSKSDIAALEQSMKLKDDVSEEKYAEYYVKRDLIIDGNVTLAIKYLTNAKSIRDNERINISLSELENILNNDPYMEQLRKRGRK